MTTPVSISALAQTLDRSEAFLRMVMRFLSLEHEQDTINLEEAITLIRYFSAQAGDQAKSFSDLDARLQHAKDRELELSVALEILKRERSLVETQNETLAQQLERATERADRLEAKLHELTESFAHLLDQRDRLVARQRPKTSRAVEVQRDGKPMLLLIDPIDHSGSITIPH